uniref:Uncharacterized protein n=2 Tax=root TaxID=1 RepID=A0A8S5PJ39_9CAUD|nr:MAG TPA: hypothetical protein [Siphoviridae sp. ctcUB23]
MAKAMRLLSRFESGRSANLTKRTDMQWIKEPVPFTGYYEQMLALDKREAALLARILQKPLKELRKRLERLDDIHESGEATERQENRRCETEEKVSLLEYFIELSPKE